MRIYQTPPATKFISATTHRWTFGFALLLALGCGGEPLDQDVKPNVLKTAIPATLEFGGVVTNSTGRAETPGSASADQTANQQPALETKSVQPAERELNFIQPYAICCDDERVATAGGYVYRRICRRTPGNCPF